jgi:DNA-binding transcriptional LysR family regulator
MEPDWSDLKVILAIARARSVVGAARAMGVDQSTVSRRLASLEDAVGAGLVVRGGRELVLTSEGRLLQAAAERIDAIVGEASTALRAAKDDVSGTVRLSCPPAFVMHVMQALKLARAKYPGLSCEVSGDYRTVDLAKGESDVALRAFRPTEPDLVARRLADMGWGVYAAAAYRKARGLPRTIEELPAHLLVLYPATMHTVGGFKWMDDHKGDAAEVVRVDNIEAAMRVISSGGGIGVLPGFITADHAEMVRVFEENVFVNTTYCVYHESARNTARVRAASDALVSYFEANAAGFASGTFSTPGPT